ncbi:MAG: PEP-CTERM sorting domain-containing protein [Akkermansiaceae bacterium]|nr:PEP-CTERM sorting domain-containing protein [Akkermansiaceae bacterium]
MKLGTLIYNSAIGMGLSLASAQAVTVFTNAVDTNFLNTGNWDNGLPDGSNGAGRLQGDAQLSADHDAGSSAIVVGYGVDASLIVDSGVTLTTTNKVDVGRTSSSPATGTLTLNGTVDTPVLNVLDGTLNLASTVDLTGTTKIFNDGILAASGSIAMVANAGAELYFMAESDLTGGPGILQLRNGTALGFQINAAGNHAVIDGSSMQVRFANTVDLVVDFDTAPTIGQTFDLMTGVEKFTNFSGAEPSGRTFSNVTVNGLGVGQSYNLIYNQDVADAGYLRLQVVPEPSSAALLGLGGLALILRRRK